MGRGLKKQVQKIACLCLASFLLLVLSVPAVAASAKPGTDSWFNVMLVIDGSGSLVSQSNGTDREAVRYDAIRLFMALLTDQGNNVGAIVFDDNQDGYLLDTEIDAIEGREEKLQLADQIQDAGTGGDTDIGTALLSAVEKLEAESTENDLPSAIILFSDGRTDLGGDEEAYEASLANKEEAIRRAQEDGIQIYSICLAASDVADPAELQEISSRTSGSSIVIQSPDQLTEAFEQFYRLIFSTSSNDAVQMTFSEDGVVYLEADVPAYGAREINLILNGEDNSAVALAAEHEDRQYTAEEMERNAITAGNYKVYKIVSPKPGEWNFVLHGQPGSSIWMNMLYNVDVTAHLATQDGADSYGEGQAAALELTLERDGEEITDPEVTEDYTAVLSVVNLADGQSVRTEEMTVQEGRFVCDLADLPEGSYEISAQLQQEELNIASNSIRLSWNNTAPEFLNADKNRIVDGVKTVKKIVTPITGRSYKQNLSVLFSDGQDESLHYEVASSQLVDGSVTLKGEILQVNTAKSCSGDLVIRAIDSQGAYQDLIFRFKVTNLTLPILLAILIGGVVAIVVAVLGWRASRPLFNGQLTVENAAPGFASLMRGSFRGKIKLKIFPIGPCGFDTNKCFFKAGRGGRIEFCAPGKIYVNGIEYQKSYTVLPGRTVIYADENKTQGIIVRIKMLY